MATPDVIREAALYLEYFLKGLSECSVIGSYTVQFLETRGFSPRLQSSLAAHLLQLISNMKSLLVKIDESFRPFCNAEVQTDTINECSFCKCQESLITPMKSPCIENSKEELESCPQGKTYEAPELVQLLSSPLIQLKHEITCVPESVSSSSTHCAGVEMTISDIDIKDLKTKNTLKLHENNDCSTSQIGKCVLSSPLSVGTPLEHMELDYVTSAHLDEAGPGEILLHDLEGSEVTSSDGLMYSVYTMNPGGSLQLVSRVLSKSSMPKDSTEEQAERTVIKTTTMKETQDTSSHVDTLSLESMQAEGTEGSQEEMVVAPDISSFEEMQFKKPTDNKTPTKKTVSAQGSPAGTILTDIVRLGPEDLGSGTWCSICEKEFPSAGSLKIHLSRAHSQVKWCLTCTKTMNSEEEMCDHVRECHSDLPFICVVCGQTLRTNAAFQRHMDIHKGLRGSACEVCGQTFSRTEYYREHKRIHTGEKPYECETCKKTFSRSSNLYAHMRIHNEEQRHICDVCMKSFARADKLKDHMIRHLQIKRYACRLCPKAYNEKRDLTKHLEKIHTGHDNIETQQEFVIGTNV